MVIEDGNKSNTKMWNCYMRFNKFDWDTDSERARLSFMGCKYNISKNIRFPISNIYFISFIQHIDAI